MCNILIADHDDFFYQMILTKILPMVQKTYCGECAVCSDCNVTQVISVKELVEFNGDIDVLILDENIKYELDVAHIEKLANKKTLVMGYYSPSINKNELFKIFFNSIKNKEITTFPA